MYIKSRFVMSLLPQRQIKRRGVGCVTHTDDFRCPKLLFGLDVMTLSRKRLRVHNWKLHEVRKKALPQP
jgi:hypothetical protein